MSRLILHVDGSNCAAKGGQDFSIGWGVVALHHDQHHEASGHILYKKGSMLCNMHEGVAFIEGVLYARKHRFAPKDVTLYTDCDVFGHAAVHLHPDNFSVTKVDQFMQRLYRIAAHAYDHTVILHVLDVLRQGRVVKVKGHQFQVYQERTDYLAKYRARRALGDSTDGEDLLSMDDWLNKGLVRYTSSTTAERWRASFVGMV